MSRIRNTIAKSGPGKPIPVLKDLYLELFEKVKKFNTVEMYFEKEFDESSKQISDVCNKIIIFTKRHGISVTMENDLLETFEHDGKDDGLIFLHEERILYEGN